MIIEIPILYELASIFSVDNVSSLLTKQLILQSIVITDTYEFTKDIFNSETLAHGYCDFEIDDDTSFGIDLMITGGGYSDRLYKDSQDRIISSHILENIFGKSFHIDVKCEEIERECEDDVLSFDYHYSLYMQGFPNNLKEIKEGLFGKERILTK